MELNTGEVALVVSTHPGRKLKPKVEILLDDNKHPVTPRIMDLGSQTTADSPPTREIKAALPDGGAFGLALEGRIKQLMAKSVANHS